MLTHFELSHREESFGILDKPYVPTLGYGTSIPKGVASISGGRFMRNTFLLKVMATAEVNEFSFN